jgi:hypothetical protein
MTMTDSVKSHRLSLLVLIIAGFCAYLAVALILHVQYLMYLTKVAQGVLVEPTYPRAWMVGMLLQKAAILISFASIFWGIRRVKMAGKSILHACVAIIGIGMCIVFFLLNLYENNKMHHIYKGIFDAQVIPKLETKLLKKGLPLKNRAFIEKMLAKEVYLDQNHRISITDESGKRSLFNPTDEDMKYRRLRNFLKDAILRDEKSARNRMVFWLISLLLGVGLGRFLPARKANQPIA